MPAVVPPWQRVAAWLLAASLLGLGIADTTWPWLVDDAYISLRYAERLVGGDGLTWTDGERVEGYSNLAWILLTALFRALGADAITTVRVLGLVCTAATFAVLLGSRVLPSSAPALLAVAITATLAATATWTTAGLEVPLLMLALAVAFAAMARGFAAANERAGPWLLAGSALGLAMWTRPDSPLWLGIAVVVVATFRGGGGAATPRSSRARRIAWLVVVPILALLAQSMFRVAYYGEWLPNTAFAKVAPSAASRAVGCDYAMSNAAAWRALLVPAALGLAGLFAAATRTARNLALPATVALAAASTIAWWAYIVQVGGDAFPRGRLLVPSLVPLTILAAHGLGWLAAHGRAGRIAVWLVAASCIGLGWYDARHTDADPRQRLSTWEQLGVATGDWLGRAFASERPLLAVDAAGAVPFASRLPCLDMLGLCDHTIARTPFPPEEPFVPGHSRANGAYVLGRQPDLIMFGTPPGTPLPQWLCGKQIEATRSFRRDYRNVLFDLGVVKLPDGTSQPLRIPAWTRTKGKLGPRRAEDDARIEIPSWWLDAYRQPFSFVSAAAQPGSLEALMLARELRAGAERLLSPRLVGVLSADGSRVVGEFRTRGRFLYESLPLTPGRYRLHSEPPAAPVELALVIGDGPPLATAGGTFRVPSGGAATRVDVVCTVPDTAPLPLHLAALVLTRID
jgi:arabinofuranosyltransferase